MRAGSLNNRITIQSKTTTYDSYGGPVDAWADTVDLWAQVETTGGGDFYAAQKLDASVTAVFTVRYRTDLTSLNRIKYGTRIFDILGTPRDPDGLGVKLLISAKEVI